MKTKSIPAGMQKEILERRKEINMDLDEYWLMLHLAEVAEDFVTELDPAKDMQEFWTKETKRELANVIGCSERSIYFKINKMLEKGFIIKHPDHRKFLMVNREIWYWVNLFDKQTKNNEQ
jgi:hypothetical protein